MTKVITIKKSLYANNDQIAAKNQAKLDDNGTIAINIMASPGAGKTTLILASVKALAGEFNCAVVEGDVAGDIDAEKVQNAGIPVVQINTDDSCHLRANMLADALAALPLQQVKILFIENVGNLVCPAGVALGEHLRLVVSSTAEGDDKPTKYPAAFRIADAVIVSKSDIAEYVGFDMQSYERRLRQINSQVPVFYLSAHTGEGMAAWVDWLRQQVKNGC